MIYFLNNPVCKYSVFHKRCVFVDFTRYVPNFVFCVSAHVCVCVCVEQTEILQPVNLIWTIEVRNSIECIRFWPQEGVCFLVFILGARHSLSNRGLCHGLHKETSCISGSQPVGRGSDGVKRSFHRGSVSGCRVRRRAKYLVNLFIFLRLCRWGQEKLTELITPSASAAGRDHTENIQLQELSALD